MPLDLNEQQNLIHSSISTPACLAPGIFLHITIVFFSLFIESEIGIG